MNKKEIKVEFKDIMGMIGETFIQIEEKIKNMEEKVNLLENYVKLNLENKNKMGYVG